MKKEKYSSLKTLYTEEFAEVQRVRYQKAIKNFTAYFGEPKTELRLFSAPGRTEIGGNHTDHNHGKVLAAGVNLDVIAVVEPIEESRIIVKSEGFDENSIDITQLEPVESEKNTADALIRGVAKGFVKDGYKIGGFKAYTTSNVLKGSGLSSSAAFEVLIGTVLSYMYNNMAVKPVKIAQIAQYAENVFFGKPSGLMDQMASSVGGFVEIDFKDPSSPIIAKLEVDFAEFGHALCIIDTKGDHADLTPDYAAVPQEMKAIAQHFSVDYLRQICREDIVLNINTLREKFGDRAVLRALHFFDENERVDKLSHALKVKDFDAFLNSINESGNSSYKYLQNVFSCNDIKHQGLGIGLNFAEHLLARKGASRVHGGGFAGTIQAFVPIDMVKEFKLNMEKVFGSDSCHLLSIRPVGGTEINMSEIVNS